MEKIGQVMTSDGSVAKVQIRRATACGEKCSSCKGGCSTTSMYINAENKILASPGQMVKVETETIKIMKGAALAYIFPLIMLFIGLLVGYEIFPIFSFTSSSDLFAFVIGLIFMAISYFVIRMIYNQRHVKESIEYKITKKF